MLNWTDWLGEFCERLGVRRELATLTERVGVDDFAHDTLGVEDERVPVGDTDGVVEHAVRLADLTVGPIVRQDGEGETFFLAPRTVGEERLAGDRNYLGIEIIEGGETVANCAELTSADTGERKRDEHDKSVPTLEVFEADLGFVGCEQGEWWCGGTDSCSHGAFSFFCGLIRDGTPMSSSHERSRSGVHLGDISPKWTPEREVGVIRGRCRADSCGQPNRQDR